MIKAKRLSFIIIIIFVLLALGSLFILLNYKKNMSEAKKDLFYMLEHCEIKDIHNIKLVKLNPPEVAVCISQEDKSKVIDGLFSLRSKLLSKTIDDYSTDELNFLHRYDIYIAAEGLNIGSPIQMFDNYIIYYSYLYYFEENTQEVFNHIYNNLSDAMSLKEFEEKFKE